MKNWFFRTVWQASVVVLGLLVTSAWAAQSQPVQATVAVPGVGQGGTLDLKLGSDIQVKGIINTDNRTFHVSGKGSVINFTRSNQTYRNLSTSIPDTKVTKSLYQVNKHGKCTLQASGLYVL